MKPGAFEAFEESRRAWEKLNLLGERCNDTHPAFLYFSVISTEWSLRGAVLMLFDIVSFYNMPLDSEAKIERMVENLRGLPSDIAEAVLCELEYANERTERNEDLKREYSDLFLKQFAGKSPFISENTLRAYVSHKAREAAQITKENIAEVERVTEEDIMRPKLQEVEAVMREALFRYVERGKF